MPHVTVKLWPGKSQQQKFKLADELIKAVTSTLGYGEESVSIASEEISAADWLDKVYKPDIVGKATTIVKKPGYGPQHL